MKILLSSIPSDSHTWNLVYLQLLLEERGDEVINLGACVPIPLLLETSRAHHPQMIVISSVNGHANIEGVDIAEAIRCDASLNNVTLVIGGKLGTKGADNVSYRDKLYAAGFDAVFGDEDTLDAFGGFMASLETYLQRQVA